MPNNGNGGVDYDVFFSTGTLTQDIVAGVTINQLFMSGGTLILANPLTLDFGLQFTGGSITSGTLNINGDSTQSALMTINGTTFNNFGQYTVALASGSVFSGGGSIFNNSGALLGQTDGGTVSFNIPLTNSGAVSAESGTFILTGGGTSSGIASAASDATLQFGSNFSFVDGAQFTGVGAIQFNNSTTTTFSGTITNNGNLLFNSAGNFTDLVLNGNVTLTGSGVLTLIQADRILGSGIFTNASTIQGGMNGSGNLGNNAIGLINQTTGVIEANLSGLVLRVDPNATSGLTNMGLLQASQGGLLLLTGNGGGAFNSTGGMIVAQAGSQVQLTADAALSGGILSTVGTGEIHNLDTASLANLTNAGAFVGNNNSTTTLTGTITNSGSILLASAGNFTDLSLNGNVTLTGGGVVTLTQAARILGSGILTNVDNIIQGGLNGSGNLGNNAIGIVNQVNGLIDANVAGQVLLLDPNGNSGLVNQGLLQASNGGLLVLTGNGGGGFDNSGATISALNGSQVRLTSGAAITGGALSTAGTGEFHSLNTGSLIDLTNAGVFIGDNSSTTTLVGTINNTGSITLASVGNFTDLSISGDVSLTGGGVINFTLADRILGSGILTNVDNIIQGSTNGSGNFGNNAIGVINQANGLIDANVSGEVLRIDPGLDDGLTNNGIMQGSGGGLLLLTGNGGGAFNNDNGVIQALDGSEVQLTAGATINGGILTTAGSGVIRNLDSATLNGVTNSGSFIANNNSTITFTGTITNTGSILLASVGNFTDLAINDSVTLTGGSTLSLQSAARVLGSGTLFIGGTDGSAFTIQGAGNSSGNFGNDTLTIVNRSGGLIVANNFNGNSDVTLRVDPSASGGLTNLGTMQASNGGILLLTGNGGGGFANGGGLIQALDGSQVQLTAGASITGGNLLTAGSGTIVNLDTATLTTLTNSGAFVGNNNTTTNLIGTITNTGSISLNSVGNFTDLSLSGNVTLQGGGTVNLTSADRILGSGTLTNVNNTIQGGLNSSGNFGNDAIGIVNQAAGLISANVSGLVIRLDPNPTSGLINQGVIQASNGGIALFTGNGGGAFTSTGGTITAQTGSEVQLTAGASLIGGTLSTVGTGLFRNLDTASLTSLTNGGTFVANNNTTTTLAGTITNSGSISLNSVGNFTDLSLNGDVTLTGGGVINLTQADRILGSGTLTNTNNTIQGGLNGSGNFGNNAIGIINQAAGLISANTSGQTLLIDPNPGSGLINNGTMQAINGGVLVLSGNGGGDFTNNGTIKTTGGTLQSTGAITSSGTVDVGADSFSITGSGAYIQSAGTFRLAGGTVTSSTALAFNGGLVDARGTINAAINNSANLQPALGGNGLIVNGAVSLLAASKLTFQLGGLTQGSQYGFLNVNGTVALGGNLVVTFVNSFQATNNDNFTVLSSTAPLSGTFSNVASGSRVAVSDSSGTFLVTYNGNNVVLSNFLGSVPGTSTQNPNSPLVATTASATQPEGSEAARPTARARRGSVPRTRVPRTGIVLQTSNDLVSLMENAAPAANGTVTVLPTSAKGSLASRKHDPPTSAAPKINPRADRPKPASVRQPN